MALFDVALHLIGGQNIPNYVAIKHLNAEQHILLTTKEMKDVAKRLKGSLIEYGSRIVIEDVEDAFQLSSLIANFTELRQRYEGKRIALNVTGGTKLMVVALLNVFPERRIGGNKSKVSIFKRIFTNSQRAEKVESFYVEAHGRNELISITRNMALPLVPCFDDAKIFVSLQSPETLSRYKDRRPGEAEIAVARELRKVNGDRLKEYAFFFADVVDKYKRSKKKKEDLSEEEYQTITQKVNKLKTFLSSDEAKADFEILEEELGQEKFWTFLAGHWFEVYTYNLIQTSGKELKQKVQGLRLNVPIFYEDKEMQRQERQELDLVYTDGFALCAIECKARKHISQEDVQKLENNVLRYGGTFGRGVLVSAYEQDVKWDQALLERVKTSKHVMLVHGKDVEHLEEALLNWRPGVWNEKLHE